MFRVLCFATPQNAPFLPFSGSSLMTGACHHLWPVLVLREDPSKAQKAVLSIAGAKVRRFSVTAKFRHVIRSDFQQLTIWKLVMKNKFYVLWGASLCFSGIENYVLWYKSACYKVIPDYGETCSVFSIQFFSLLLPLSVKIDRKSVV